MVVEGETVGGLQWETDRALGLAEKDGDPTTFDRAATLA
jgi:hypothetical protein